MAARAYWQGQIRLALVSIPVEVYPATKGGAGIAFNQIHEPSGQRIRYEKVAPGVGPVDKEDIVKGYEYAKGDYVLLDDDEIEAVKIESRRTLDLVQFVDADEIDVLYYEKPFFVVPADDLAEEAYIVLREALKTSRKVGLGQLSVRGREVLVTLKPCGRGIVLEVLRYSDEVRRAQTYFADLPDTEPDPDLLDLATTLIDRKTARFEPEKFHDRYVEGLQRLIDKKIKAGGKRILEDVEGEAAPQKGNVIDLMAALRKSLASGEAEPEAPKAARKAPARARKTASSASPARRKRA